MLNTEAALDRARRAWRAAGRPRTGPAFDAFFGELSEWDRQNEAAERVWTTATEVAFAAPPGVTLQRLREEVRAVQEDALLYGDTPAEPEPLPTGPFTVGPFGDQGDGTVKASLTMPLPSVEEMQAWVDALVASARKSGVSSEKTLTEMMIIDDALRRNQTLVFGKPPPLRGLRDTPLLLVNSVCFLCDATPCICGRAR